MYVFFSNPPSIPSTRSVEIFCTPATITTPRFPKVLVLSITNSSLIPKILVTTGTNIFGGMRAEMNEWVRERNLEDNRWIDEANVVRRDFDDLV
jgi:hypothetical protein